MTFCHYVTVPFSIISDHIDACWLFCGQIAWLTFVSELKMEKFANMHRKFFM